MGLRFAQIELTAKLLVVINGAPLHQPLFWPVASSLSLPDRILADRI